MEYPIYSIVWFFFIYAFLGWCAEVCFVALNTGEFVNRGFLNGPYCPIYGFGMVIIILLLTPVADNKPLLFAASVLLTSALEWLVGFVLEKVFHQRWWDYTDTPFNISGYICLKFSLLWGVLCLIVMELVQPPIEAFLNFLPRGLGWFLLALFIVGITADLIATVRTILKLNVRLGQIDEIANSIRKLSDELSDGLSGTAISAMQKSKEQREQLEWYRTVLTEDYEERKAIWSADLEAWKEDTKEAMQMRIAALEELYRRRDQLMEPPLRGNRRLLRAFPKMRSLDYESALKTLREKLKPKRKKED